MYLIFPVIVIVLVLVIVLLQCLSCRFEQNQKVNIADMHYDYDHDYDNDKKQATKSVLQSCKFNACVHLTDTEFCGKDAMQRFFSLMQSIAQICFALPMHQSKFQFQQGTLQYFPAQNFWGSAGAGAVWCRFLTAWVRCSGAKFARVLVHQIIIQPITEHLSRAVVG